MIGRRFGCIPLLPSAFVLLFAGACVDLETTFLELPELRGSIAFLVELDELDGRPTAVTGPYDLRSGFVRESGLELENGRLLALLVLDDERIAATGARRSTRTPMSAALELRSEPCAHGHLDLAPAEPRLRIAAKRVVDAYVASVDQPRFEAETFEEATWFASASISVNVESGGCTTIPPEALRPLDPDYPHLLPPDATVDGRPTRGENDGAGFSLGGLEWLTDSTLLALTKARLFLFELGRAYEDRPERHLATGEVPELAAAWLGETSGWLWRFAKVASVLEDGRARIIAGADTSIFLDGERAGNRAALVEIELDGEGFVATRTATIWAGRLDGLIAEPDGGVYALWNHSLGDIEGDSDGWILRGASSVGPWEQHLLSPNARGFVLRSTGDRADPHAIGWWRGYASVGDLGATPLRLRSVRTDLISHVEAIAAQTSSDGLTLWIPTDQHVITRVDPKGTIGRNSIIRMPIDAGACSLGVDTCGWPVSSVRAREAEFFSAASTLVVSLENCTRLVTIRLPDLCTSMLPALDTGSTTTRMLNSGRGLLLFTGTSRASLVSLH